MEEGKSAFSLLETDVSQSANELATKTHASKSDFQYEKKDVILKVDNVCLDIDGNKILKDVCIEVRNITRPGMQQGQIIGFLGPSGIGKTQLFEILAGLKKPTSGQVLIGNPLKPVEVGDVGVVQQSYPLFKHRTIYGNLDLALKKGQNHRLFDSLRDTKDMMLGALRSKNQAEDPNKSPREQRRDKIEQILKKFGLLEHKSKYPAQLSGGQRQRVAIAQQILCSDDFLLLDEPFSGLDVVMIEKVQELLLQISQEDEMRTIIIVSHDVTATAAIADTLWVMGRDHDDKGNPMPGSRIMHEYDLIERNLTWHKDIQSRKEFFELVREVKGIFPTL